MFGLGLKLIFHWKVQSQIFFKSLFNSFAEVVISCVTENGDVSWANNIALEDRSPYRSKITMVPKWNLEERLGPLLRPSTVKNYSSFSRLGPLLRPSTVKNYSSFSITQNLHKRSKRLPDMLFCDNLKNEPFYHILSKALEMSRRTRLPIPHQMNCKFRVVDDNWLMQESLGLKPDWFGEIRLFSSKKLSTSLKIVLSKNSAYIGKNKTGR